MEVEYKLFYKPSGCTKWKHFFFDAIDDKGAIDYAVTWVTVNCVSRYGLEKIITNRVRLI